MNQTNRDYRIMIKWLHEFSRIWKTLLAFGIVSKNIRRRITG